MNYPYEIVKEVGKSVVVSITCPCCGKSKKITVRKSVVVSITCPCCGKSKKITVPVEGLVMRENGELIQKCFPDLPVGLREMFISGLCPDCFPSPEDADVSLATGDKKLAKTVIDMSPKGLYPEGEGGNPYKGEDFKTGRGFPPRRRGE